MSLALRRIKGWDHKFKVNLGYSKFEASLTYMVEEGEDKKVKCP